MLQTDDFGSWEKYETGDLDAYIPIENWGKDHWSTLGFLETRVVDFKGVILNASMRCNPRLHRVFAHVDVMTSSPIDGSQYPTRLKGGAIHPESHDDWSCLEDMVAAGLLEAHVKYHSSSRFGGSKCKVELTDKGREIAAQLRVHRSRGGRWDDFEPETRFLKSMESSHDTGN